jgi:MEMO1 family protein
MISRAVLMCHAPIVIPEIGGRRSQECSRTTAAMTDSARFICDRTADVMIVVTPHGPRTDGAWCVWNTGELWGSFERFGHPELSYRFRGAPLEVGALCRRLSAMNIGFNRVATPLDHGALVPLHFVAHQGWQGKTLVVAPPYPENDDSTRRCGQAIRETAQALGQTWCILASGDMSHRLLPGAPGGYHKDARRFDAHIVRALEAGDLNTAIHPDQTLRSLAAEDVIDSLSVVAGAVQQQQGIRVLNYEGPFGVGYTEAILHDTTQPTDKASNGDDGRPPTVLVDIAKDAILAEISGRSYAAPRLTAPWDKARAVFVTLRTHDGALRGCIGALQPRRNHLAAEVAETAVSAATNDPRFPPLRADELDGLQLEISVLEPPETVSSKDQLDPAIYGVVVSSGSRRGVLLPAIPGVDSVDEQLDIARQKGFIGAEEAITLQRFRVRKVTAGPPLG